MRGRQKLDAVLPLKFNDCKRFRILGASLKKFIMDAYIASNMVLKGQLKGSNNCIVMQRGS